MRRAHQALLWWYYATEAPAPPPPPPTPTYLLIDFENGGAAGASVSTASATGVTISGTGIIGDASNWYPTPDDSGLSGWGSKFARRDGGADPAVSIVVTNPTASRFTRFNFMYVGGTRITVFGHLGGTSTLIIDQSLWPDWFDYATSTGAWAGQAGLGGFSPGEYIQRIEFRYSPTAGGDFGIDQIELASNP